MKTLTATILGALLISFSASAQIATTTTVSCVGDDLSLIDLTSSYPFDVHTAQVTNPTGRTTLNLSDEIRTIKMISATGGDTIEVKTVNDETPLAIVKIGRAGKPLIEEFDDGDYKVITTIKMRGRLLQKNKKAIGATCEYKSISVHLSGIGD